MTLESVIEWAASWVPEENRARFADALEKELSERFAQSEIASTPAQEVPDGMWYFTFYCENRDAVQRVRVAADAPRQFTCGVTGIAKKEATK